MMQLGRNDVICGRHKVGYNHSGNVRFRTIIRREGPAYQAASSRAAKKQITLRIMEEIQRSGGRFWRTDDSGTRFEADSDYIYEKVSHALRSSKPEETRSRNSSPSLLSTTKHQPLPEEAWNPLATFRTSRQQPQCQHTYALRNGVWDPSPPGPPARTDVPSMIGQGGPSPLQHDQDDRKKASAAPSASTSGWTHATGYSQHAPRYDDSTSGESTSLHHGRFKQSPLPQTGEAPRCYSTQGLQAIEQNSSFSNSSLEGLTRDLWSFLETRSSCYDHDHADHQHDTTFHDALEINSEDMGTTSSFEEV